MRPAFHSMLGLRTEVEPPGPLATVEGLRGRWWIDERLLKVHAVHRDLEFSDSLEMSLGREIRSLAAMLDLEVSLPD